MKTIQALVSLSLVAGNLAAPTQEHSRSSKLPIKRTSISPRNNGIVNGAAVLQGIDKTLKKYGHPGLSSVDVEQLTKRAIGTEALKDDWTGNGLDRLYYGDFNVRDLKFVCDYDTGSSDLFVPGPNCTPDAGCLAGTRYDDKGQDLGNTTSITYGSGDIEGENWLDDVTVGGITAKGQNVIVLNSANGFNTSSSDSLCGLAFDSNAKSGKPTFFSNMVKQGSVDKDEFSFYFGRGIDGTGNCSELTLGGRDESKISGELTTIPVSQQKYWQTDLDGVDIGGQPLNITGDRQAIHDTGTTVIVAPFNDTLKIAQALGGEAIGLEAMVAYPCNNTKSVDFVLGGRSFSVNPKDLNLGKVDLSFLNLIGATDRVKARAAADEYCLGGIIGLDLLPGEQVYILGDTFMKSRYSIFSYSAASGAPAVVLGDSVSGAC